MRSKACIDYFSHPAWFYVLYVHGMYRICLGSRFLFTKLVRHRTDINSWIVKIVKSGASRSAWNRDPVSTLTIKDKDMRTSVNQAASRTAFRIPGSAAKEQEEEFMLRIYMREAIPLEVGEKMMSQGSRTRFRKTRPRK